MKLSTKITRACLCLSLVLTMLVANAFAEEPVDSGPGVDEIPVQTGQLTEVPVSQTEANINGRQTLIKVFEVSPDVSPESLKEYGLVIDGYEYTLSSFTKETTTKEDVKSVTKEQTVSLSSSNKNDAYLEALKTFSQTIQFSEDGYEGELNLVAATIEVSETGRSSHSASDVQTKTYKFDYNDDSLIPASISVNGNTYKKSSVSWSDGDYGPDGVMPDNYIATVKYSRSWSYSSVDGYQATASYTGDVSLSDSTLVRYTAEYIGTPVETETPGFFASIASQPGALSVMALMFFMLLILIMAVVVIVLVATRKVKFDFASAKSSDTLPAETREIISETVSAGPEGSDSSI